MGYSFPPQRVVDLASRYLQGAKVLFARNGGRLWGCSLDGPMTIVDYDARQKDGHIR